MIGAKHASPAGRPGCVCIRDAWQRRLDLDRTSPFVGSSEDGAYYVGDAADEPSLTFTNGLEEA